MSVAAGRPTSPIRSVVLILLAFAFVAPCRAEILSWVPTDLTGIDVSDVVVEPGGSGRVWAATRGSGLMVSTDRGRTFVPHPVPGMDPRVNGIDFDPQDPSVLYAATSDGLLRVAGSKAVRIWPSTPDEYPSDPNARWISTDPVDSRVLLVGAISGCIFQTQNGGTTWSRRNCGHYYRSVVGRALFDPSGSGLVLAPYSEFYEPFNLFVRSADHGATWSFPATVTIGGALDFAVAPGFPGEVYVSQGCCTYCTPSPPSHLVSRDFGLAWSSFAPANPDAPGPLVLLPSQDILSAGPGGVFRTDRAGSPWVRADAGLPSGEIRRIVALDDAGEELLLATSTGLYRTERSADPPAHLAILPALVDATGGGGARFTTSLTIFNASDGMAEGTVDYVASESTASSGSGRFPFRLRAREQLVVGDASTWLRSAGLAVPEATAEQPQVGTLKVRTSAGLWGGEVVAVARVTTPSGAGLAGTGLWSLPASSLLTTTSYLPGLRETAGERTNVAVVNAGAVGRITLRATFRHVGGSFARETELDPGQWAQWNSPLGPEGVASADAEIERIAGDEPYTAYATIVDRATNDGSVLPARSAPVAGPAFIPVAVEANGFETEVVLFNPGSVDATASLVFSDSLGPSGAPAPLPPLVLSVPARSSVVLPHVVHALRRGGIPVGPSTVSHAGLLQVEAAVDGHPVPVLATARTTIPAPGGGAYGVSYPAVSPGELAHSEAWVTGLGPAGNVRSKLALLNPGADAATLEWRAIPGNPKDWIQGLEGTVTLQPREWKQILLEEANGTSGIPVHNAVVRVRKISGSGPFAAYGVVNDGKSHELGTGDGTYIPMSAVR